MDSSSQPLATESFSYSWLATTSSSDTEHKIDPEATNNFDFDISNSSTNFSLAHADKLFSNGVIRPRWTDDSWEAQNSEASCSSITSSLPSPSLVNSRRHTPGVFRMIFLRKWSKFPTIFFSKCISCLSPVKTSGNRIRVDDASKKALEVKSWSSDTPQGASPRKSSVAMYNSVWSKSDESSISEAILYCKQSSGLC